MAITSPALQAARESLGWRALMTLEVLLSICNSRKCSRAWFSWKTAVFLAQGPEAAAQSLTSHIGCSSSVSGNVQRLSSSTVVTASTSLLRQTNGFIQQKLDALNSRRELGSSWAKMVSFPLKTRLIIKHRGSQNIPCCSSHLPLWNSLYKGKVITPISWLLLLEIRV